MKKKFLALGMAAAMSVTAVGLMAGCGNGSDGITVAFTRPSTSGTYGAFNELVVNSEGKSIDEAREEGLEFARNVQTSQETGNVITDVSAAPNGLGYISLGSVAANTDKIKAVKVNGVEATVANIESGSERSCEELYQLHRERRRSGARQRGLHRSGGSRR